MEKEEGIIWPVGSDSSTLVASGVRERIAGTSALAGDRMQIRPPVSLTLKPKLSIPSHTASYAHS